MIFFLLITKKMNDEEVQRKFLRTLLEGKAKLNAPFTCPSYLTDIEWLVCIYCAYYSSEENNKAMSNEGYKGHEATVFDWKSSKVQRDFLKKIKKKN